MAQTISMVPLGLDWELYAGDYRAARFRFVNKSTGLPVDLTGEHYGHIRRNVLDPAVLGEFEFDLTDAVNGVVLVVVQPSMTSNLVLSPDGGTVGQFTGEWDWQWSKPGNVAPLTLYRGHVLVHADVSRVSVLPFRKRLARDRRLVGVR